MSAAADCSGVGRGRHIRNAKVAGSTPVSGKSFLLKFNLLNQAHQYESVRKSTRFRVSCPDKLRTCLSMKEKLGGGDFAVLNRKDTEYEGN